MSNFIRLFILLALVMASGVLRLQGQMSCNWVVDQTLIDESTSNFASNYFENKVFEVQGVLSVDQNTYFSNCIFYMTAGSSIVVDGVELTIDDCQFGCEEWEGISGTGFIISRNSYYQDFTTAFLIGGASAAIFTDNIFQSDETGIGIDINYISSTLYFVIAGIYSEGNQFNNCFNGIRTNFLSLGLFDNNSTFSGCYAGILSNASNIYLNDSRFEDCFYGIQANHLSQINMLGGGTTINFENCAIGIEANYSTFANIIDSKFETNVSNSAATTGVIGKFDSNLKVSGCSFDISSPVATWNVFILSDQSRVIASGNVIDIPNGTNSHGFHCSKSPYTELSDNTISLPSPNIEPNSYAGFWKGGNYFSSIDRLLIHEGNEFNSNISVHACGKTAVYDNFFNYPSEIYSVFGATKNNLFCNNIFEGGHSLRLENACFPTKLGTSEFKDADSGLEINDPGIGIQFHLGNKWSSASYARRIAIDETKFYVNSMYDPCDDPEHLPENIYPNDDWFTDLPGCPSTCERSFPVITDEVDGLDSAMIDNSYSGSDLNTWYQSLNTFEKLWLNPSLMSGYSAAETYYDNGLSTDLEAVTKTHWYLDASRNHATYSPLLEIRNGQKLTVLEDIYELNELLAVAYNSTYEANLATKVSQLITIEGQISQLIADLADHKTEMLDSAELYNNLIGGVLNTFVEHEQFINGMVIEKERDPDFIPNSGEFEDILEVAILCPNVYGKSVYLARSFISPAELEEELGEVEPCTEELIASQNNHLNSSLNIIPNPVKDVLSLQGINPEIKYSYQIVDIYGKLINSGVFNNSIVTTGLDQGVYFIKLENKNGFIISQKFIKL
ncbi:MAG: T9SS type A sorting domain-containing protein [Saprospiraceae bacterium]|nr:T9SS type A sorting domain-containing protein [Saprospiraceae bacterium]